MRKWNFHLSGGSDDGECIDSSYMRDNNHLQRIVNILGFFCLICCVYIICMYVCLCVTCRLCNDCKCYRKLSTVSREIKNWNGWGYQRMKSCFLHERFIDNITTYRGFVLVSQPFRKHAFALKKKFSAA